MIATKTSLEIAATLVCALPRQVDLLEGAIHNAQDEMRAIVKERDRYRKALEDLKLLGPPLKAREIIEEALAEFI